MIPKLIHYCWFGGNPKPPLAEKCIRSWKKHCKGYEIIQWNEDNFDISLCPLYVRQAYAQKKWAFITDYVRLKVVYDHGGICLDTDVELHRSLDPLLPYHAYFGFENGVHIATGLGFGAEKGAPILAAMMEDYKDIPFVKEDGSLDTLPCPQRNTAALLPYGLRQDNSRQLLEGNILILPSDYLCPLDYNSFRKNYTKNTVSTHWFSSSWQSQEEIQANIRKKKQQRIHHLMHTPNRVLMKLLGEENYARLKGLLKRER